MADLFLTPQGVGSRLSVQNSESTQPHNSFSISISGKAPYSLYPCFPRKPWNHRTLPSSGSLRKSHPLCPALQPQVSLLSSEVPLHRKVTRLSLLNLRSRHGQNPGLKLSPHGHCWASDLLPQFQIRDSSSPYVTNWPRLLTPPSFFFFFGCPTRLAGSYLVHPPGVEPRATAVKAPSADHWTARELPPKSNFNLSLTCLPDAQPKEKLYCPLLCPFA